MPGTKGTAPWCLLIDSSGMWRERCHSPSGFLWRKGFNPDIAEEMDCAGHEGEKTRGGGEEEERKRERERGGKKRRGGERQTWGQMCKQQVPMAVSGKVDFTVGFRTKLRLWWLCLLLLCRIPGYFIYFAWFPPWRCVVHSLHSDPAYRAIGSITTTTPMAPDNNCICFAWTNQHKCLMLWVGRLMVCFDTPEVLR